MNKNKDKRFTIRLTEEEYNVLKDRAHNIGLTVAAYILQKTVYAPTAKGGKA